MIKNAKELSEMDKLKISNHCYAIVSGSFASFLGLEKNGSADFKIDRFSSFASKRCETEIFLHFEKNTPEVKELAKKYGHEIAEYLIQNYTKKT